MHSSPFPWQVFPDIPVPSQCEFETCGVHCNPTLPPLPHVHGTSRFSPGPPREAFCCNYEPFVLPCVSSVSSLTTTAPSTKKGKGQSEQNKEKKLTCGICKKTFLRPSAIRVHMRIHNGEKPFKCIYCPRSFSQSGNLTVHLRMHTGERPFTCPICCKGFSQSNSLKVHIRTHTGEKPFQCKSCMKRFADRSVLGLLHLIVMCNV